MAETTLLTVQEVAKQLRVHPRTVRRWINAGKLEAQTLPGRGTHGVTYRISTEALQSFLAEERRQEED